MKALITPNQAREAIAAHFPKLPTIACPLDKCAGRILQQAVTADRPFPPFHRSMMDGYAFRAAEVGRSPVFTITLTVPAGHPKVELGTESNCCAEIMTGAVVPDDVDCVVPYEATERIDDRHMRLLDPSAHQSGDCIHPYGSDREAGSVLLEPGVLIGGREIAVAASCGYTELNVGKIPSIAIVSTGDELVEIGIQPEPHQIRRSNDIAVETALARVQLHAQTRVHLPDDSMVSSLKLKQLTGENQVVLISGGISMGKKDYIPEVLDKLGLHCHFHGVRQKPGKPMGFWSDANCAVFTLPGNPSSTLTCLHHYVIPSIFAALGQNKTVPPRKVSLDAAVKASDDLTIFLPVELAADNRAIPQPTQNSGDLVRILQSDGYIELPPCQEKSYPAGKSFDFHCWH